MSTMIYDDDDDKTDDVYTVEGYHHHRHEARYDVHDLFSALLLPIRRATGADPFGNRYNHHANNHRELLQSSSNCLPNNVDHPVVCFGLVVVVPWFERVDFRDGCVLLHVVQLVVVWRTGNYSVGLSWSVDSSAANDFESINHPCDGSRNRARIPWMSS